VIVQPTSGLSEMEIERFIAEADQNRNMDLAKKELADLRNNAETLIYGTEHTLQEFGDKLEPEARGHVEAALGECKHAVEAEPDNLNRLRAVIDRLESEAHALFLSLQGGGSQSENSGTEEGSS
jgi:molecular chaperone DnaK